MDADGSRPEIRRARPVERIALPPGPTRNLQEMLYRLYAEADCPRIDRLAEAIVKDDELPGSPRRDLIIKIIGGGGLASQQDTVTVAVALARDAGRDDTAQVAEQVRHLWIAARTASARRDDSVVRVGRVPRPAAWFQDRHTHNTLLRAAQAGRSVVLTQVSSGLGGVGKTQLAAQLARSLDRAGELDVLAWITAANRQALIAGYADAAHALHLCGPETDPTAAADRLLSWLEHTGRRCLIVLDNLDSPADTTGLWPPDNPHGRTVVTTRRRDAILHTDNRSMITVGLFTPPEAAGYLAHATGTAEPRSEIDALAADLGLLPLALAQGAAYIRDHGIDCATYRQRLHEHGLTQRTLPPKDGLPDDHRTIVAVIWDVSITAAENHQPRGLARPLLETAALLDSNGIPDTLFTTTAIAAYLRQAGINTPDPQTIIDGLHNLHRLHLITHDGTAHYARLHDTTVRRHWEKARKVNIMGENVTVDPAGPLAEATWAKQRLGRATQSLPNGYCGLPGQKTCPHANACLTCPMFLTTPEFLPHHRQQRQQLLQIVSAAEARGQTRVVEMNRQVLGNLDQIITTLEADPDQREATADAS